MKFNYKNYIKKLSYKYINSHGTNNQGLITIRHRGSGYKQKYFLIDNKKYFYNLPAILIKIFHKSLYRNKFYGLFLYANGIIMIHNISNNLIIGSLIINSSLSSSFNLGNSMPLYTIPEGIFLNNLELYPGKGSQICKTSGNFCFIINKYNLYKNRILIKLKNNYYYLFNNNNLATIGINYFTLNKKIKKIKAGINRWFNKRPHVRGVAMNPIDHPHGGGQGKTSGGRCSVTPFGKLTKGKKTKKIKKKFFIKKIA